MISCILLAAGLSERFGSPKALAQLNNQTVIERLQSTLIDAQVDEIIIVLGHKADELKPFLLEHKNVQFVYNKDYKFGQTSSFQAGLKQVSSDAQGIMLLPVDFPFIQPQTLIDLIGVYQEKMPLIHIPSYKDKKGHPPIFSSSLKSEFLHLDHDTGINTVAHQHQEQSILYPVSDPGVIQTFNTQEEFNQLKDQVS